MFPECSNMVPIFTKVLLLLQLILLFNYQFSSGSVDRLLVPPQCPRRSSRVSLSQLRRSLGYTVQRRTVSSSHATRPKVWLWRNRKAQYVASPQSSVIQSPAAVSKPHFSGLTVTATALPCVYVSAAHSVKFSCHPTQGLAMAQLQGTVRRFTVI